MGVQCPRRCFALFSCSLIWALTCSVSASPYGWFLAGSSQNRATNVAAQLSILRNQQYGFELNYPTTYRISSGSVLDPAFERTFYFEPPSSGLFYLQVADLEPYLRSTSTPTLRAYLDSLRRLQGYRTERVADKDAYEYLVCGRASCDEHVVFIVAQRQYTFVGMTVQHNSALASLQLLPMEQREVIKSIRFLVN
jgi:hypothetical protein